MSSSACVHWTAYVSALLVPVIAFGAVLVAAMQWYLARQKLKLDLFDKRMEVHNSAHDYLGSIVSSGSVSDAASHAFLRGTWQAKWLYSDEFAEYLREIYHKAINLDCLIKERAPLPIGEERTANVRSQSEIKKWVMRQHDALDEKSAPYLKLGHGSLDMKISLPWRRS